MLRMKKIVIYGAGGFGREIACLINSLNIKMRQWELIGFIDDGLPVGHSNHFGTVLGALKFLNSFPEEIAVALSVASPNILRNLVNSITNPNVWFPNLIASDVKFHDPESFCIGKGNILFFSSRISCNVTIGDFNLFNSLASLGHDVRLGSFNVVGPTVRISGDAIVGDGNFFGVQSIVLQGIKIGNNTRIGVSSVIMRDTKDDTLYFGNPAKRIKS
jgi:sugar O-acyltransferase (sialic acid O-acetyltransferase NeuD family)